jgi:uncharacterized membrane protein YhdT
MSEPARPYLRALWLGAILFVAGIARDLQWHSTHEEFEGTSQQFEAHWLLWIGFLVIVVAAVLAFLRLTPDKRHPGFTVVLAASAIYLPVTVWHFIAHADGVDPSVAHVLLAIGDATILSGVAWTVAAALSQRERPRSA